MASVLHLTLAVFVVLVSWWSVHGAPGPMTNTQIMQYLEKYGYLDNTNHVMSDDAVVEALRTFQKFTGVENPSGLMDDATRRIMEMPRCGISDYVAANVKWTKRQLTYRISKYSAARNTDRNAVDRAIDQALRMWSGATDLTFTRKATGPVDIDIGWERNDHDDGAMNAFDGQGGVLAHAFYPKSGRTHFDDEERWTLNVDTGTNLLQVATHEFGHSLGLGHSEVRAAVMAPYYQGFERNFKLHDDDVLGIQYLYGKKTQQEDRAPSGVNELCEDPSIDAAFSTPDKKTYFFKGMKYWEIVASGIKEGYPKSIISRWPELPGNINAAFTYSVTNKTYFFKRMEVWRYNGLILDPGYPKKISEEFPGLNVNYLDSAFEWSGPGHIIHFFRDDKYWTYSNGRVDRIAKTISKLRLPSKVNAALRYDYHGYRMYFFKDRQFYRFDDRSFRATPETPLSTAKLWLQCPGA